MKRKDAMKVSRRRFLEAAVVTAAAQSVSARDDDTTTSGAESQAQLEGKRFEEIVATYGSELGDLRKVT